ncbi:MAG TPA: molybdopterin-dependent oxidoreductase [Actinomycetota bacterium]|nr:molybdopterin-dependent oxidoreductase [Actinomycetota bacterium]
MDPARSDAAPPRWVGAVLGLVVAGVALAAGQVVAAFVAPDSSPIVAVARAAIDLTPEWLKSFAIETFGEQDKVALIVGIVVVIGAIAAVVGIASLRRPAVGVGFLVALGAVGGAAALTRPNATATWALPSVVAVGAGIWAFRWLLRARGPASPAPAVPSSAPPYAFDRRTFVRGAVTLGGVAVAGGLAGAALSERRFAAVSSRAAVRIPTAADPAPPLPAGVELGLDDLTPFVTPNRDFYRVDTALFPPQVRSDTWSLRIHGMVDRPREIGYEELLAMDLVEHDVTLSCVSNEVGGPYAGNARWTGALLGPLLEKAGVHDGADQLVSRSADGMTIGTPTAAVMDGREAMLAVAMNGEPLPIEHGFPVRMIVPGLYGYVSATKWIVDLEATTFQAFDAYWVERGWTEDPGPAKTMSRIDTPRPRADVAAGQVAVAGVAWAQHRGIERVEVRVDDGDWQIAELADVPNVDTWRQWVWRWEAIPGTHTLEVRATDGDGVTQPEERTPPFPDGATGWHAVVVDVG